MGNKDKAIAIFGRIRGRFDSEYSLNDRECALIICDIWDELNRFPLREYKYEADLFEKEAIV